MKDYRKFHPLIEDVLARNKKQNFTTEWDGFFCAASATCQTVPKPKLRGRGYFCCNILRFNEHEGSSLYKNMTVWVLQVLWNKCIISLSQCNAVEALSQMQKASDEVDISLIRTHVIQSIQWDD